MARRAERFVVVVDSTKLVERLNLGFLLPVEVLAEAWRQVQAELLSGRQRRIAYGSTQAGPVVTDPERPGSGYDFADGISDPAGPGPPSTTSLGSWKTACLWGWLIRCWLARSMTAWLA